MKKINLELNSMSKRKLVNTHKINWNKILFKDENHFKEVFLGLIEEINDCRNPIEYKKIINKYENRFLKQNIESMIKIGKKENILDDEFIEKSFKSNMFKKIENNNLLYLDKVKKNYIYTLYKFIKDNKYMNHLNDSFENAYGNIFNLSKEEYLNYLNENPNLKENWFEYFKEIMKYTNDLKNVFNRFNIFEFPSTISEMTDVIDIIKNKRNFENYFSYILENKNIDLVKLLELAFTYNDDSTKQMNFFNIEAIWKLIDNENLNDECLKFLPNTLKYISLKNHDYKYLDSVDYHNFYEINIDKSIENIFIIENLTLERYKLLEKIFNLSSLDNSLFNLKENFKHTKTQVNNKSKNFILDYFDLLKEDNTINNKSSKSLAYFKSVMKVTDEIQLGYSISGKEDSLSNDVFETLIDVVYNSNLGLRARKNRTDMENSLGGEYIGLINNKELFDYIFEKYEKTLNKEAFLIVFSNIYNDGIENLDNFLSKYNYDISNYSNLTNQKFFRIIMEDSSIEKEDNHIYNNFYFKDSFSKINNGKKLKIKIDNELHNEIKYWINKDISDENDFNIKYGKLILLYQSFDSDELNEVCKTILNTSDDSINEFQKKLIEENNVNGLEIFEKILNESGMRNNNDNEIKIKRRNKF